MAMARLDPRSSPGVGRDAPPQAPRTPSERRSLLEGLGDSQRWPAAAAALLTDLGFRLIEPDEAAPDENHLLIGLRARPTLRHFDPEMLTYYAPAAGGAALASLDRTALLGRDGRLERPVLWGQLQVVDRVPVTNRFLTFGGILRVAAFGPELTLLDLWSPAPIVRWGGHSQGTDALTEAIGAFFGRLMVPVDFTPGAEERIDAVGPRILYRAFLLDAHARAALIRRRAPDERPFDRWITRRLAREASDPAAGGAAERLLVDTGLRPAG
jgi:hypothetical protein